METWKPIEGFPRYEISDHGAVRTISPSAVGDPPKLLKPKIRTNGYIEFTIYRNQKPAWRLAHRLVASAFLSPDLLRPVVNHKDGNKANNRASNLEWSTLTENNRHADARGVRHAQTNPRRAHKLTAEIVAQIKEEHAMTGRTKAIAERFNLSTTMVQRIVYNRSWTTPVIT